MRDYHYICFALGALAMTACTDSNTILISPPSIEGACDDGERVCEDGELRTCSDGEWDYETCEDGCNSKGTACRGIAVSECSENEKLCDGNDLKTCRLGEWTVKTCPFGCDSDAKKCKPEPLPDDCTHGDVRCHGDALRICLDGTWSEKACEFGCDAGTKACRTEPLPEKCEENAVVCEGDVQKTCVAGEWIEKKCEYGCDTPKNTCAPKPETPPECEGTQVKCENGVKMTCSSGKWQTQSCTDGCNAQGTDCAVPKVCTEGESKCADGKMQTCTGNAWKAGEACKYGCRNEKACAQCKEGATSCKNGKQSVCKDDKITETTCQYGCDSAGKKCEEVDQMQPSRYLMKGLISPITPYVVEQMKKIKAKNSSRLDNVFIEIGDSHYDYDDFMTCFSDKTSAKVTYGNHTDIKSVVAEFQKTKDSFGRDSLAARGGRSTRDMFSSSVCGSTDCITQEISAMNPRFAFFGHGSNDLGNGSFTFYMNATYPGYQWSLQDYYRQLNKAIDKITAAGVIPLISGVAPSFTAPSEINYLGTGIACNPQEYPRYAIPSFNAVSRGVAEARQLPWLDIYSLFYPLPNHGLRSDNIHCRYTGALSNTCGFDAAGEQYGCNMRNLYSVKMLDKAWRTVIKGEEAADPIEEPFRGKGTQADPYLVTSIPFTHQGNTTTGESKISVYPSCSNEPEGGNEYYYKLVLTERKYLRMFALSASNVDVDIHVMKDAMDGNKCIARSDILLHGYLDAGTYYISVDTYSDPLTPGQYLLGIVECSAKNNGGSGAYDYDYDKLCYSKPLSNVKG